MMALSPFCIFAVRLLGWLPGDTVFINRGYRDDDDDDLFEFRTAEGNFNFTMFHPLTIICFFINYSECLLY